MPEGRRKQPLALFDKAKPTVRWGRKATGLISSFDSWFSVFKSLRKTQLLKDSRAADGDIVKVSGGNALLFFAKSPRKITRLKLVPLVMHKKKGGNHEII